MLHDNGFKLADKQSDLTPIQKYVYTAAKNYHEEKREKKTQRSSSLRDAHSMTRGGLTGR